MMEGRERMGEFLVNTIKMQSITDLMMQQEKIK